ncbi:hypothetical protein JCM10450v2_006792 [Rhodotorula kratochvilovae]
MSPTPEDKPDIDGQPKAKKPRTTTACNRCRRKRGRCDGQKPVCGPCVAASAVCEYELGGDKRKPYTKAVVQAMQLRIDTLEAQLAALTGQPVPESLGAPSSNGMDIDSVSPLEPGSTSTSPAFLSLSISGEAGSSNAGGGGLPVNGHAAGPAAPAPGSTVPAAKPGAGVPAVSGPTSMSFAEGSAPQVNPNPNNLDTFQGGLAINAHGELRFYGPTSSYRAVLADSTSLLNTPTTVNAIRAFSLTRAPIPTASPADPALPRRPPELSPDFKVKLLNLAFEYCFAHYNIVPERQFFSDLQMYPFERTQFYSPFLMNVILAVGCRYLDPEEYYPPEICGLIGDPDTRGDVFITWSRYLLDQEWYNPALSTIRGLLVLGLYLAGRGFDGPCFIFVGLALKLTEDFGLNLGPHRLSMSMGIPITDELVAARRDCFWSAFCSDIISSMYIGRGITFTPDVVDTIPPPIVPEFDFDAPLYRSSAFHWASRLIFIASKVMTSVYTLKPGISLAQRQSKVPELHLLLESWYHELPSHLRASGTDPAKAPHPHILVLNMSYHMAHISLHRPFFRRHSSNPTTNVSTEKCLVGAGNIVRLVKLLRGSAGLRLAAPGVQHAAFTSGTVLAISAVEDGISDNAKQDLERRAQAKKDLRFIVQSLKEIGTTWTTAHTSAGVLEALMSQWEAASSAPTEPSIPAYAPHGSPTLSASSTSSMSLPLQPSALPGSDDSLELDLPQFDLGVPSTGLTPASLPRLEQPSYVPHSGAFSSSTTDSGETTPVAPTATASGSGSGSASASASGYGTPSALGLGFLSSRPGTAAGADAVFGAASLPFMYPSWDLDNAGHGGGMGAGGEDFMSLLNVPDSTTHSAAQTPAQSFS